MEKFETIDLQCLLGSEMLKGLDPKILGTTLVEVILVKGHFFPSIVKVRPMGKGDAITVDINAIALFRQAIGSSPGINDGTTRPENFGIVVNDEVLHRVMTMVKESTFVDQVVKAVVDTEEDCTKNDERSGKMVCDDS
ncbi:hypothetical protein Tco_1302461 [Tanacetum coccineum]